MAHLFPSIRVTIKIGQFSADSFVLTIVDLMIATFDYYLFGNYYIYNSISI